MQYLFRGHLFCFSFSSTASHRAEPPHLRGFYITHNDAPQSVGLLLTSDQPVAESSIWQHTTVTADRFPCPPVGFEPTISEGEWPQTYFLHRATTGTSIQMSLPVINITQPEVRFSEFREVRMFRTKRLDMW